MVGMFVAVWKAKFEDVVKPAICKFVLVRFCTAVSMPDARMSMPRLKAAVNARAAVLEGETRRTEDSCAKNANTDT